MTALDTKALLEGRAWVKLNRCPAEDMPTDKYMNELARRLNEGCDLVDVLIASAPRLARRVIELEEALNKIAEGDLADPSWQDGVYYLRKVARAALKGEGDE